jgi:hypothetical protein
MQQGRCDETATSAKPMQQGRCDETSPSAKPMQQGRCYKTSPSANRCNKNVAKKANLLAKSETPICVQI